MYSCAETKKNVSDFFCVLFFCLLFSSLYLILRLSMPPCLAHLSICLAGYSNTVAGAFPSLWSLPSKVTTPNQWSLGGSFLLSPRGSFLLVRSLPSLMKTKHIVQLAVVIMNYLLVTTIRCHCSSDCCLLHRTNSIKAKLMDFITNLPTIGRPWPTVYWTFR